MPKKNNSKSLQKIKPIIEIHNSIKYQTMFKIINDN